MAKGSIPKGQGPGPTPGIGTSKVQANGIDQHPGKYPAGQGAGPAGTYRNGGTDGDAGD